MKIRLLLLAFISFQFIFSQNIDSLKFELQNAKDTNRINILLQIVDITMYSKPNIALDYALQAFELSSKLNDTTLTFTSANNIGIIYNERGDYKNARRYFTKSLDLLNNDSVNLARTYGNIGNSYNYESDSEQAIVYYLKSLKIFEALNNEGGMSLVYGTIGNLYLSTKDYKHALENYKQAEKLFLKLDNQGGLATVYMNMGVIYRDGDKKYNLAISNFEKALKIYKAFSFQRGVAQCEANIAESLSNKGNYKESTKRLVKALNVFHESKNYNEEVLALIRIGDNFTNLKDLFQAQEFYNKAYNIAVEEESIKNIESSSKSLYQNYKAQKDYPKALAYFETFQTHHDSLYNIEKEKRVQELLTKYDTEKKEKEIQKQQFEIEKGQLLLSKKEAAIRFYLILTVLITAGLLLIAFAYFQKRRINILLKGQNALIEKQNKALAKDKTILSENLKDKSDILDRIYTDKKSTELPSELLSLSKREMEVLSFLALGWTDKEISEKLFVSVSTTKTHLRRIYSKLLVKGRAGAVAIAHKHNIIGGVDELGMQEDS